MCTVFATLNVWQFVTAALGNKYSPQVTNGRVRTQCARLTLDSGCAHQAVLPGPRLRVPVLVPQQLNCVIWRRLLSLSLLICKMDTLDKISGRPQGLPQ